MLAVRASDDQDASNVPQGCVEESLGLLMWKHRHTWVRSRDVLALGWHGDVEEGLGQAGRTNCSKTKTAAGTKDMDGMESEESLDADCMEDCE